jgi:hypothetical protein
MDDPRWDDGRERDDARGRVSDQRDRTDHDPRDGLMHDLDLPRGDARELVIDRDRVYELNGSGHHRSVSIAKAVTQSPKPAKRNPANPQRDELNAAP